MKKRICLVLSLIMLLSLCACGSTKSAALTPVPMPEMMYDAAAVYQAPMEAVAGSGLASYASTVTVNEKPAAEESGENEARADKIIYSADATVETTAFEETLDKLDKLIEKYGAWVESSSVSGANYSDISRGRRSLRSASYTLRIPAESFDTLMQGLSDLGNVPYSHIYTENVTARYYDTQARLGSYKTQEQSLLRLMEKAESVEDIITVEDKLSEVRYNIESLQSMINNYDRQVSYSSVYLSIEEVAEYTPSVPVNPSFGERIAEAFSDGIENAIEFLSDALVWLIEALPALVLLAVVIIILSFPVKKLRAKRKAKKAAKQAVKTEEKK
ncbi:MAG: DUF4349 domain-containing protein [Eubacteriales bacterium]|nr:DUF4349 domain-containing protein [Eubacteriales bacterium]